MNSERKNITQPADWWEAFARQAVDEGLTLSEWLGECGSAFLTEGVRDKLSVRSPAHRPSQANNGVGHTQPQTRSS